MVGAEYRRHAARSKSNSANEKIVAFSLKGRIRRKITAARTCRPGVFTVQDVRRRSSTRLEVEIGGDRSERGLRARRSGHRAPTPRPAKVPGGDGRLPPRTTSPEHSTGGLHGSPERRARFFSEGC